MSTLTCYNPGGDRAIQTATFLLPSLSPTHSVSEEIQTDCFNHQRAQVALSKKKPNILIQIHVFTLQSFILWCDIEVVLYCA